MKLYALHDKVANSLSSFNVQRSDAAASRAFADAVLEEGSQLGKYPDDFELVSVCDVSQDYGGDFSAAEFITAVESVVIVTARQIVDLRPVSPQLELLKKEA